MRMARGVVVCRHSTVLAGLLAVSLSTLVGCSDAVPSDDIATLGVSVSGLDYNASHTVTSGINALVTAEGLAQGGVVTITTSVYDGNALISQIAGPAIPFVDFPVTVQDGFFAFDSTNVLINPGHTDVGLTLLWSGPNLTDGVDIVVSNDDRPQIRTLSLAPSPVMEDDGNGGGQFVTRLSISDPNDQTEGGNDITATGSFTNGVDAPTTFTYNYVGSDGSFGENRENFDFAGGAPVPSGGARSYVFIVDATDADTISALPSGLGVSLVPPNTRGGSVLNDPADSLAVVTVSIAPGDTTWTIRLTNAGAPVAGASFIGWDTTNPTNNASGSTNAAGEVTLTFGNRSDGLDVSALTVQATYDDAGGTWHAVQGAF